MSPVAAFGTGLFDWMKGIPPDTDDSLSLLRALWYETAVQDIPEALRFIRATIGTDRILLSSAAVFASLTEAVQMVKESSHLTDNERMRF